MAPLVLVAALALGSSPDALGLLRRQCASWGNTPKNPWALGHGLRAFGATFTAADGRLATAALVHDALGRDGFPSFLADGTPVEPHPNLLLKTLVSDVRLPPGTRLETTWGSVTVQALVDRVVRELKRPTTAAEWGALAWTLDVLATTQAPGARWQTSSGELISLDQLFDDALEELERETHELNQAREQGLPQLDKRATGLYAQPCGGLHFVQGVLAWARHPAVRAKWGPRIDLQIDILVYRLGSERRQYNAALALARRAAPELILRLLAQQLKFYGHFLETAARWRTELGWRPRGRDLATVSSARQLLRQTTEALAEHGAFSAMPRLAVTQPQLFLDLIGDSCHAAWALGAWEGAR